MVITQEGQDIYLMSGQFDSKRARKEFAYTAHKYLFGKCHHAQAKEKGSDRVKDNGASGWLQTYY